jgi:hypothetical protein
MSGTSFPTPQHGAKALDKISAMCSRLDAAKAVAMRASREYRLASTASKESPTPLSEGALETARLELQGAEKAVVDERVQLLAEMVAHPLVSYAVHPPVPVKSLPPSEISVQYTYALHSEAAAYQPQRERVWRVPIVWTALKPLFDKAAPDSSIDEALQQVVPHLTRFATGDSSTSAVRRWVASNFRACSSFQRHADVRTFPREPAGRTQYPGAKALPPNRPPLAIYSAGGGGQGSTIDVVIDAIAMDRPEEWHSTAINAYVGRVLEAAATNAGSNHSCTTCTCIITDRVNGVTHYLGLHPFRSPDVCHATHLLVCDSHGILGGAREDEPAATPHNELQTHHRLAGATRLTEMELNSIHATAVAHNEEMCHHAGPVANKSARISSQSRDIIVSSYLATQGTAPAVYTTVSVITYPLQGLAKRRERSACPEMPRGTIALPWGARPTPADAPSALVGMVRALQGRIECMEAEKSRADGNRDHLLHKLLKRLDPGPP